ncbi:MAG: polyprenyl diphosphate synthase [Candidatus Micrarchaeia archaeon]
MATKMKPEVKVPYHIALIPDGNRRWARSHKIKFFNGYNLGVKKFVSFSIWAKALGVKVLTVWALSTENLKNRSKSELNILFKIYIKAAKSVEILKMLRENNAKVNVIGNLNLLPAEVRKALHSLERKTKNYSEFTINLLIGYGGREDLIYALRHSKKSQTASDETFKSYLITSKVPDVDLIIRTSGEKRLSGFLPWQASYSELYFAKKYWPDFNKDDLRKAITNYSKRERRFGK